MRKIIVIEGIDCSGKETQIKYLKEWLESIGYLVGTISFPNYNSPTGRILGGPYLGKKGFSPSEFQEGANHVDAKASALLYAADRAYNKEKIEKLCQENDFVLIDRYTYSDMAYQGSKLPKEEQKEFFEWIEKIEFHFLGLPKPDICFFLDMPIEEVRTLLEKRKEIDQNEKDLHYLTQCKKLYSELGSLYDFKIVCCYDEKGRKLPSVIADEIKECLKKYLN